MTRSLARRCAVALPVAGVLAAAVVPAVAQAPAVDPDSYAFEVSMTGLTPTRHFTVTDVDGGALDRFEFGLGGDQPFKVNVTDTAVPLVDNGFEVVASMSNLYLDDGSGPDWSAKIPSDRISLSYSARPSASLLQLPVVPTVDLGGSISCSGVTLGSLLTDVVAQACNLLSVLGLSTLPVTLPPLPLPSEVQTLTETDFLAAAGGVLDTATLPLSLTGGAHGGPFRSPATFGPGDPESGASAEQKTVMQGLDGTLSGVVDDTLGTVQGALEQSLSGVPLLPDGTSTPSLLTTSEVLQLLSSQGGTLASVVALLPAGDPRTLTILSGLTATLEDVSDDALSVLSGTWSTTPVLSARGVAAQPGTYVGKLYVDYIPR